MLWFRVLIGIMTGPRAVERRQWIRDAWTSRLPEEMQAVFVIGGTNVVEDAWKGDILRVNARETYPPGEKMLAFMSYCVSHLWSAGFCIKTDDDVVISGRKLLYTLAPLYAASRHIYLGATLWASFAPATFEVCGHGMGPKSAWFAGLAENCRQRGALGPFPYAVGTLEVLSVEVAELVIHNSSAPDMLRRASALTPSPWTKGEDTALGMFVYEQWLPMTCLHAGWALIHDLCFECKDKTQLWRPVTASSIAVHLKAHQAVRENYEGVAKNMSLTCDSECEETPLAMEVDGLRDLCSRYDEMLFHYRLCEYDY